MTDDRPTHLDLFSGIGGFALAAEWAGFRTVAFCEIDAYCQADLKKNFGAVPDSAGERRGARRPESDDARQACIGSDSVPIFSDIFDFRGAEYRGVSLLTGGFPCQPFSVTGKRGGAKDDRHLWPEMLRVIDEARPAWVLGENVPGIIPMELDNVLSDLEAIGYACRPFTIPACAVDAKHRRDRLWIVAHDTRIQSGRKDERAERERVGEGGQSIAGNLSYARCERDRANQSESKCGSSETSDDCALRQDVSDTSGDGCRQVVKSITGGTATQRAIREIEYGSCADGWARWEPEPSVGRVANGIPNRVDRLRGLGNAIVPQVAYEILKVIRGM